jgi:hypothetical protein
MEVRYCAELKAQSLPVWELPRRIKPRRAALGQTASCNAAKSESDISAGAGSGLTACSSQFDPNPTSSFALTECSSPGRRLNSCFGWLRIGGARGSIGKRNDGT